MDQEKIMLEIKSCFQTQESYAKLKIYKEAFKEQPQFYSTIICDTICLTMTEGTPMSKLLALRLCKEIMDFKTEYFTKQVNDKLLSKLQQIASFRKDDQNEQRGKFLFSDNPSKEIGAVGNSLMKLCLDCIKVWAVWYPQSNFKQIYDQMINEGVTFPTKFTYFKEYNDNPSSLAQSQILSSTSSKEQPVKYIPIVKTKLDPKQLQNSINTEYEQLKIILEEKSEQSITDLKQLLSNLESEKNYIESIFEQIIESGDEQLVQDIIEKQEQINKIIQEYQKYLKNQNWNLLKVEMSKLLPNQNIVQQVITPQPNSDSQTNQAQQIYSKQVSLKQKEEQKLSIIREETVQDENLQEKSKQFASSIPQMQSLKQPQQESSQGNNQSEQKQERKGFLKKALSLKLDDEENNYEMKKLSQKQTDYTNTQKNSQYDQPPSVMNLGPPDECFETKNLQNQNEIKNSIELQKQNKQSSIQSQISQAKNIIIEEKKQDKFKENNQFEILQSEQIQQIFTKKQTKKEENIIQSNNDQQQLIEGTIQPIQNSEIYPKKLLLSTIALNQNQQSSCFQTKSTFQNSFQQSPLKTEKLEKLNKSRIDDQVNISKQSMEIDILKKENIQLKQDLQELKLLYEQKQKQNSLEMQEKINEISKLKIKQNDYSGQEKQNNMLIQSFSEYEKISLEFSTLQYQHSSLKKQYVELNKQYEELKKESALKSKQITIQNRQILDIKQQFKIQFEQKKRSESVGQYSKTAQQFFPVNQYNQSIQFNEENLLSDSQRNLIFPFASPQDYYRDKISRQYKGQLSHLQQEWHNINLDFQNLIHLKQSILSNQSILFTNKYFEIGCKLEKVGDQILFLHLYFLNGNKLSSFQIDLNVQLAYEISSDVKKHQKLQLYQDSSEEVSFQMKINQLPFGLSIINLKLISTKTINQILYLPISIFPFIIFHKITIQEYSYYWSKVKNNLKRTDLFNYDFNYVSTILAQYFQVLELNSHKKKEFLAGIDEIKYGSLIQLFNNKYIVRYTLQPNRQMVIQINLISGRQEISSIILTNFQFLLSS